MVEHKSIKRDPTNDEIVDEVQAEQPSPKPSRRIISKNKTLTSVPSSFSPFLGRARSSSLRQTSSSSSSSGTFASETPPSKGGGGTRGGKFPLLKQPTLSDAAREDGHVGGGARGSIPEEKEEDLNEWRGLRIDVLKSRIRRLVVLMNLSEPGTIPDAGMLASLIDLVSHYFQFARSSEFSLHCYYYKESVWLLLWWTVITKTAFSWGITECVCVCVYGAESFLLIASLKLHPERITSMYTHNHVPSSKDNSIVVASF